MQGDGSGDVKEFKSIVKIVALGAKVRQIYIFFFCVLYIYICLLTVTFLVQKHICLIIGNNKSINKVI